MNSLSISTERLELRPFQPDDVDDVHAYASDPVVTRHTDWGPNSLEETQSFVREAIDALQASPLSNISLAIVHRGSRRVIGTVGLELAASELGDGSTGFCLNREFWGRGFATEAAQALMGWASDEFGLRRIYATCRPDNRASARVLEKLGFVREGRLRKNIQVKGQWRDSLLYASTLHEDASTLLPPMEYLESLPRKRMGSGVLFLDDARRILIVRPTYKDHWEIPGGVVEAGESPRRAAARETTEELGIAVEERTLEPVCVDYLHPTAKRTEALMFVFVGGTLSAEQTAQIRLADHELTEYRFSPLNEAVNLLGEVLGPRVTRCMQAVERGGFRYHELRSEPQRINIAPSPKATLAAKPDVDIDIKLTHAADHVAACEQILRNLPAWFGIEEAIVEYVAQIEGLPTVVAQRGGETVGFVSIERHRDTAAEIIVMAVTPSHHRRGVGRALLKAAEDYLRDRGVEFLQVKTLSDSHDSPEYARTRRFYRAVGFRPLQEFSTLWDEGNPCLQMIKWLG